jgi:serine/threonine protein phosphatase PrpC
MMTSSTQIRYACEQQLGGAPGARVQQDRIRVELVRNRSSRKMLMAVVVDGDGHPQAGKSAEIVIAALFESVRKSKNRNPVQSLEQGIQVANQALAGSTGTVSVTAILIRRGRLHYVQAGHTSGMLVRAGAVQVFSRSSNGWLDGFSEPQMGAGRSGSLDLQTGDRLVLASDGLTRASDEDGKPYLRPEDIPIYVEDQAPREAARHLISLALGRDAQDNLSVIVIRPDAKRQKSGRRAGVGLALLAAILSLGALVFLRLQYGSSAVPIDYGYAVLVKGSALAASGEDPDDLQTVARLAPLAPRTMLLAQEPVQLNLQTNREGGSDLAGAQIYLAEGASVQLDRLDAFLSGSVADQNVSLLSTQLDLGQGQLLIVRRSGSREYVVFQGEQAVILGGAGEGIMAISSLSTGGALDCILGMCRVEIGDQEATLVAGESVSFFDGSIGDVEPLPAGASSSWNSLCADCLFSP